LTWFGAQAPDPGSPDFPALLGLTGGVLATGVALALGWLREEVEWLALLGAFIGGAVGLAVYLGGVITNLY
jgi:hypothetical protein